MQSHEQTFPITNTEILIHLSSYLISLFLPPPSLYPNSFSSLPLPPFLHSYPYSFLTLLSPIPLPILIFSLSLPPSLSPPTLQFRSHRVRYVNERYV